MEFIDGVARDEYPDDMVFEEEKLLLIIPDDIENIDYGTPTPGPNDKLVYRRGSKVEFGKKGISLFMPDCKM